MKKAFILAGYVVMTISVILAGIPAAHAGCEKGDCRNGPGKYTWPDGSRYTGDFLNSKFHGQGTYAWADGKKYVGGFENDKRSGFGTYTWPNGASYRGEWENGKKAGYGIYTFPDGRKSIGIWENGTLSQEMEEAEVEKLMASKPEPAAAPAAAAAPASEQPVAGADQSADSDLDKQLAALGGTPEPAGSSGEESLSTTEAAAAVPGAATDGKPFILSVQKLLVVDGSKYKTWSDVPLLAEGPIATVGTCSVKIDAGASDKNAGKLMVQLKVANSSTCPLDFKGFLQSGEYYVKVVSWSGDQAIAPKSKKEMSQVITLAKEAPRSEIMFKLQGAGCAM